jgi:transposase-like protein
VARETGNFNYVDTESPLMSLELEHYCPECDEYRDFWKVASTTMHLGRKNKWHCPECDYGFVRIDNTVDTSQQA